MKISVYKNKILLFLMAIIITFIWVNSIMPREVSNIVSNGVTEAVGGIVTITQEEKDESTSWLTSDHIRKLAHVVEFTALGIVALNLLRKQNITNVILLGFSVAIIDETIQLFNNRSSMVKDVWIDMFGFAIAMLLDLLIRTIAQHRKRSSLA